MMVNVRYFAAARAAAGVDDDTVEMPDAATLADLEIAIADARPALARVLPRCSYLRDEIAVSDRTSRLGECRVIDVLPPFAGG